MANNGEYEMAVKIAGEIEQSFYKSIQLTKKELTEAAKSAVTSSTSIKEAFTKGLKEVEPVFGGLEKGVKKSFQAVTAGIGASLAAGAQFESAFAGIKKTVNTTDAELTKMQDGIRRMSREMPNSAVGLSGIAEEAGRLGIKAENITGFTKTIADLDTATNLASNEGAVLFAEFAEITGMAQDHFERLGSSIVALGSHMDVTEADIIGMGLHIGAAGSQAGLSQAQIMGYSAALASAGIEAESGGSAFSKLLSNLQTAAETGKGLEACSQAAGMTGKQFKMAFREDAAGAFNAFLSGIRATEQKGKDVITILNEMGLTGAELQDTILRAVDVSGMLDDALKTSEIAWRENTALTNEATQRYEAFENQCSILKNKVADVGISVYDSLKPGLAVIMELTNHFIDSITGQEGAISNMLGSITKKMPSMAREVRLAGEAVVEFSEPFLKVGGWLIDNPGILVGAIVGVGTALATYKIASGIMSVAFTLGSLGPVGAGILAISGTAAVIAGIGAAAKKSAEEAKEANLAEHFGNVSLSLKDLEEIASFIVSSESLDKVRESLAAFDELDGISDCIKTAASAINKTNFKVSIGMKLTEEEKQEYQNQVQALISSTQDYVTQEQYAVTLSVNALMDDGSDAAAQLNEFYSAKHDAINQYAEEDFDVDNPKKVAELQQQAKDIQTSLAGGGSEFEAGLDLIGLKYDGVMPDSESFIEMQNAVRQQLDDAVAAYDEAYIKASSGFKVIMNDENSTPEEQSRAQENLEELRSGYLTKKADLEVQATKFQADMIKDAYGEEWESLSGLLQEVSEEEVIDYFNNAAYSGSLENVELLANGIHSRMNMSADTSTLDAMRALAEQLLPQLEQLQTTARQFEESGESVPESIQNEIMDITAIAAIGGDIEAIWAVVGQATESEEFQQAVESVRNAGAEIDGELGKSIQENAPFVDSALKVLYDKIQTSANQVFKQPFGIMVNAAVRMEGGEQEGDLVKDKHADGGIFTGPHVAWFAEKGPEAAIPLDGSQNAVSLWRKTGELLGMEGLSGGQEPVTADVAYVASISPAQSGQISYSPVINFYGDSPSGKDMETAMETSQEKFSRMMERWQKDNGRLNFA